MPKKQDWKTKVLEIIPPRLVLGAYRDVIGTIVGLETKVFSIENVRKEMVEWLNDIDPLSPLVVERDRCIKMLPTIISSLINAELLRKREDGRFKKSENFEDFWDLTKKVRTSVEKAIRWGVYHVVSTNKKNSFSCNELIDALTSSRQEIVEVLSKLAIPHQGKWKRILQEKDGKWAIIERPRLRAAPPSVVKDISDKLLYIFSLFSESGTTEVNTDKIIIKIRSIDIESVERFLKRLHFREHNGLWLLPSDMTKPQQLIEKIEMPGRLPPGACAYACLQLLDGAYLSATEIIGITGFEKSTISRALKKLSDEDLIKLAGKKGPRGEVYYTTNCDKCWFGKDREECRDETIADIKKMLKDLEPSFFEVDWSEFSNQALNKLEYNLANLKAEKLIKPDVRESFGLWDVLLRSQLAKLMEDLEARAIKMTDEKGWIDEERIYELVDEKGKSLPLLYLLGVKHVLRSTPVKLGLELLSREKAKSK